MVMEEINGEESSINNVDIDLGEDGSMTCTKHHPDNNPGGNGICAICLQEKLGNLVTSSLPIAPSFTQSSSGRAFGHSMSTNNRKPPRIPFLSNRNYGSDTTSFQRSKSTAATSFRNGQRRSSSSSFWSFLYSSSSRRDGLKFNDNSRSVVTTNTSRASSVNQQSATTIVIAEEDDEGENSPDPRSSENSPDPRSNTHMTNKVSRSRSVGCGGRSFSGDFFERLGDCTIRRVESQRQSSVAAAVGAGGGGGDVQQQQQQQHKGIKERVRCTGFNLTSSFSSSEANSRTGSINASSSTAHGRSRSWAWALASPLRAFAKPTTSTSDNNNNISHNHNRLTPSLLSTENR